MIICFCGIPGSGKTTVARALAERLAGLGSVQLVNSDDLKSPVYPRLLRALAPETRTGKFVVLDGTFYKEEWRRQVRAAAAGEELIIVYLFCPVNTAVERNRERQPRLSERVIYIMARRMEPPDNPSLAIDTTLLTPKEATDQVFGFITKRSAAAESSRP